MKRPAPGTESVPGAGCGAHPSGAGGVPDGVFGGDYFTSSIFFRLVKALAPSSVFASIR